MKIETRLPLILFLLAPLLAQAQTHLERPGVVPNILKDHAPPKVVSQSRSITRLPTNRNQIEPRQISARRITPRR